MRGYAEAVEQRIKQTPETEPMYGRRAGWAYPEPMFPWARLVIVCRRLV